MPSINALQLDEPTQHDLDLFPASGGLFAWCNRCDTEGGADALKRRMRSPWASAEQIRGTQIAISFVLANRSAFLELPSGYVARSVERYTRDSLPLIQQTGNLPFFAEAFAAWGSGDHFYARISIGVGMGCRLVGSLRRFVNGLDQLDTAGEVAALIQEMRDLLSRPGWEAVPDSDDAGWFWQILRLDQRFRLHDKAVLRRLLELTYELDALVSLAAVTDSEKLVMPEVLEGVPTTVEGANIRHPQIPNSIGNPVQLDSERRLLFLTGPNMAGKTTYLRSVAVALYLAHLGMGVPADQFRFTPVDRLFTAISMSDDLNSGVSYFRAEALRMRAVAQAIANGERLIAVLDEPFKGTNVKDALDASLAVLEQLAQAHGCLFMVTSHLIELGDRLAKELPVDYRYFEAQEDGERLQFDFRLQSGISSQRLGMRVLREEGVFDLLARSAASGTPEPGRPG